MKPQTQLNVTL